MRKILFYNRYWTGHQLEFVKYLILSDYFEIKKINPIFLLHAKLVEPLITLNNNNYEIVTISEELNVSLDGISPIQRAKEETKWIKGYCRSHGIKEVFLFNLDEFLLAIGIFNYFRNNIKWSGILLSPYVAIPVNYNTWMQVFRKFIMFHGAMSRPNMRNAFILNSEAAVLKLRKIPCFGTNKVRLLPDPVNFAGFRQLANHKANEGRFKILVSGYIDDRKGVEFLIGAIQKIGKKYLKRIELVIAGKFAPKYYDVLLEKSKGIEQNVTLIDQYLSNEELHDLAEEVNVVSLLYKNFYYSSGILGIATLHRKPILAFRDGIIAEMCLKYNLGAIMSEDEIDNKIIEVMDKYDYIRSDMKCIEFLEERRGDAFAKEIVQTF